MVKKLISSGKFFFLYFFRALELEFNNFFVSSLGLIILEASANVILPDNGPAWHKLRSNDFSDVNLERLSPELVQLIIRMLEKSFSDRIRIDQVMQNPIVKKLKEMLDESLAIEERIMEEGSIEEPLILGAVVEERESFLHELFESVESIVEEEEDEMEVD